MNIGLIIFTISAVYKGCMLCTDFVNMIMCPCLPLDKCSIQSYCVTTCHVHRVYARYLWIVNIKKCNALCTKCLYHYIGYAITCNTQKETGKIKAIKLYVSYILSHYRFVIQIQQKLKKNLIIAFKFQKGH